MTVEWYGEEAKRRAQKAGRKGLHIGAEHILTLAQEQAPHDTGTLRRSGTVTDGKLPDPSVIYSLVKPPEEKMSRRMKSAVKTFMKMELNNYQQEIGTNEIMEVFISFNTPYAVKQHEEEGYQHVDGKAKYLEDPYRAEAQKVINNVAKEIKKALGGV